MSDPLDGALTLALAAHDGANWDVWGKRRDRYWDAFEANLRAAAMTTSLDQFVGRFARKMSCSFGRNAEARQAVSAVLMSGDDVQVLRVLRERSNAVTLRVRTVVDSRRALFEARQAEEHADDGNGSGSVIQQSALAGLDAAAIESEPPGGS